LPCAGRSKQRPYDGNRVVERKLDPPNMGRAGGILAWWEGFGV